MYRIDADKNRVFRLQERTFSELGFREREHLQEWVANEPMVLGEPLLIIQKEFSGFSDTQERLDLLALDKEGALVIIENKLDDSGRDVTWQALKYASYCSGLSKDNIRAIYQQYLDRFDEGKTAEEMLAAFFDDTDYEDLVLNKGVTQRVVLIAAKFRKEVTSTVMWLLNFNLRVQCFRATPYSMGEQLFLNVEQIIPTQDTEEYMIGMAAKAQDDLDLQTRNAWRKSIRRRFWTHLLSRMNKASDLFETIGPRDWSWLGVGAGIRGVTFVFSGTKTVGRAELYIDRGDKDANESILERLLSEQDSVHQRFNGELIWEVLPEKRACRVKYEVPGNIYDEGTWNSMSEKMADAMVRLHRAFDPSLSNLQAFLASS